MASEQNAMMLIAKLVQIDEELTRGEQPGLYDGFERLINAYYHGPSSKWTYQRTDADWYNKRLHPMQIARKFGIIPVRYVRSLP